MWTVNGYQDTGHIPRQSLKYASAVLALSGLDCMDLISSAAFSVTEITCSSVALVGIANYFQLKLPAKHRGVKRPGYLAMS